MGGGAYKAPLFFLLSKEIWSNNLGFLLFGREVIRLPGVYMGDSDTFDYSLRKFKKQVEKAGILSELKKRQHFEKPSIQKKKKEAAAKKRLFKKIRKLQIS